MGYKSGLSFLAGGLCMGLFALGSANAATISHSGSFTSDDQVQLYTYTLSQASNVVFTTNSYGGGVSNGVTVPAGGFVPVLSLFSSTGAVIGSDGGDATCSGGMRSDPTTHMCDDALLSENLAAGTYTLAVTEFFNVPVGPNLSNGFLEQGQGNFTGANCNASGAFYEADIAPCVQRTSAFSLNITDTPEPATLWLSSIPVIAFFVSRRRSQKATR